MKSSSILPPLAALAVTTKAELTTGNYHINSLHEEGYFVGIYDENGQDGQQVKIRLDKPSEPASKNE